VPLDGGTRGAPAAVQVADQWHLWHNLAEAVERAVTRHRSCLQEPPQDPEPRPAEAETAPAPETGLAARTRARHAEICAALARGQTSTEISRTLRLDPKTVRRYSTAATADELIPGARLSQPGLLGPHQAYLRQRWDEGIRSTERLHAELRDRGYRGSLRTLRRLTARLRRDTAVPAPPPAPSPGEQHGCRDAHAASAQGTRDSRQAVAGSERIVLLSGMPARARRARRRIALRWCRHKVSQPCPGRI
jgi:hypothetical protein